MNTTSTSCPKKPTCVAEALGLGSLADDSPGMDPELLRDIYRHARGEDGKRQLFKDDPTFAKDWVNLDAPRAKELVGTFVALDDADTLKQARRIAQTNLMAQPWNDVLGLDAPPIKCVVKIHGAKWGMRFELAEPGFRGNEDRNGKLPPIPSPVALPASAGATPPGTAEGGAPIPAPAAPQATTLAEDTLRKAGMPV